MEWEEELLYHVEERAVEARLEGDTCLLVEMFICPQEMIDILLKIAIQAEITPALMIQEIMHHHQEIVPTMIMVIPVHAMTIHQEAAVMETAMVVIVTIQVIHMEVPTGIHVTVMVTHIVLHLHKGLHQLMVEAVAVMAIAAHMTDVVEVETVTQAAKVIFTQVVMVRLADKKEVSPFYGKGVPSSM